MKYLLPAMFLILFALKLAEVGMVAGLSWWWVTAPLWVIPGFLLIGLFSVSLAASVMLVVDWAFKKPRKK